MNLSYFYSCVDLSVLPVALFQFVYSSSKHLITHLLSSNSCRSQSGNEKRMRQDDYIKRSLQKQLDKPKVIVKPLVSGALLKKWHDPKRILKKKKLSNTKKKN